jgi:hypothetical protein
MIDVPRIAAVSKGYLASVRLTTPTALAAIGALLAVCAFNLWITPSNPPGFLPDEASMSYNAYLIGHHLHDENGGLLPLYLRSFGDYKSPLFTYVLAVVFRVTGPHAEVARGLAAVAVLLGALLLGLFARRRTGSTLVGVVVVVLAGLTPWLFEVGRAAYEVALEPLLICLFLLTVDATWRRNAWTARRGIGVGLTLTGIAFVYAAGRLLAPLFGLALLVFASRSRWRWFAGAWGTFVATSVVPIAVYWFRHPGALTERYDQTSFITSSMAPWTIVGHAIRNYVIDINLWRWVVSGDPKPYVHTYGSGSIFGAVVLLALGSVLLAVVRRRADRFWLFTVVLLVVSPIPSALTKDRHYGLRLVPLPVLLVVVALPALVWLLGRARRDWLARIGCAVLVGLVAFQFVHFVDNFRARGWARTLAFHAGVPGLLREGFGADRTIFVNQHEPHALVYARWYAVEHGLAASRVSLIPFKTIPPDGSIVFGRFQPCPFVCAKFARADDYWLGRAEGPLQEEVPSTLPPLTLRVTTAKGSGLRVSFIAQGHIVSPGSAWAYYLRVRRHGKPWHGTIDVEVLDTKGKPVDRVGQFTFPGGTLQGYLWASADQGQVLDFTITLLGNGNRAVGSIAYRVYVKKAQ